MFDECATPPDAAVTAIVYVPAGVPPAGLVGATEEDGDVPPTAPPQPANAMVAIRNSPKKTWETSWGSFRPEMRHPRVRNANRAAITPSEDGGVHGNGFDPRGNVRERAVVEIESVTDCVVAPGVTVADGEKEALAPEGSPDTLNVTGLVNAPFEGATVMMNVAGWPAGTELGPAGAVTEKSETEKPIADDVPPPGAGFVTVMFSVPPREKSTAMRLAWSNVVLSNTVTRGLPFTSTTEPCTKFTPVTFNVSAAVPAEILVGETELPPGAGLFTANVVTTEITPPGLVTITNGFPTTAIALAGIAACNSEELTKVVATMFKLKLICEA
jgi:hypothetical protein